MGNQQSAPKGTVEPSLKEKERDKRVNRRLSVQALHGKVTAADPSATTASAVGQTISQHVQRPLLQHHLQANQSPEVQSRLSGSIGRSSSRGSSASKGEKKEKDVGVQTRESLASTPIPTTSTPSPAEPMNVPTSTASRSQRQDDQYDTSHHRHYTPVSQLRPPRLPLPIANAPIPESPTLGPIRTDPNVDVPMFEDDEIDPLSPGSRLRRKSSMLSFSTMDEEEVGDELRPYAMDNSVTDTMPVRVEWNDEGEKVYVTGTFANWTKKFRLHPSESPGLSVIIYLPPGTHHIKYIVDGDMMTSPNLPTAVDIHNVLVNYLEVSPEAVLKHRAQSRRESDHRSAQPQPIPTKHVHPPLLWTEHEEIATERMGPSEHSDDDDASSTPEAKPEEDYPLGDFRQLIPQALIDMEYPDSDPKYQAAVNVIGDVQGPPALPLFLGKSILNGVLPMKDDSSVLTLPNHTVLNHLCTSAIRREVLACSVTTRYRAKYVTTILYRPTVSKDDSQPQ